MGWSSNESQGGGYPFGKDKGSESPSLPNAGTFGGSSRLLQAGLFLGLNLCDVQEQFLAVPQSGFAEAAVRHTPGQVLSAIWTSALRPQILIPLIQCPLRRLPPRLVRVGRFLWRPHFEWQWLTGLLRQCCAALQCEPRRHSKLKPRWDVHLQGVGNQAVCCGGDLRPWIAVRSGSAS